MNNLEYHCFWNILHIRLFFALWSWSKHINFLTSWIMNLWIFLEFIEPRVNCIFGLGCHKWHYYMHFNGAKMLVIQSWSSANPCFCANSSLEWYEVTTSFINYIFLTLKSYISYPLSVFTILLFYIYSYWWLTYVFLILITYY